MTLVAEGSVLVEPPPEVFDTGVQVWANSLILQFIDRSPPFESLKRTLQHLWGQNGGVEIKSIGTNLYVVRLSSAEVRDVILKGGPWHVQNKPVIVQKWEPGMTRL
ncbi:hypothetical protein K2173_009282 [Erythroxylum novogranatense]|uniref:DUF4283 domain-containing protein n=1 Tax=Erythroxylum novogranatense TaxID=1862640 RepID=A0AAV8T008_9ROSI|nr:hypothetical protein K2173_009282 [Erythroxylum novogranatense]